MTTRACTPLPSNDYDTSFSGMNDQGDLAGYAWDQTTEPEVLHGLLLTGGQARTVDVAGANYTVCTDLNNAGDVVGSFRSDWTAYAPDSNPWGFFLKAGGVPERISPQGSVATLVHGLNDRGDLVGIYAPASSAARGFLRINGTYADVTVRAARDTQPWDLNSAGAVVGTYTDTTGLTSGFLLSNGRYTRIRYPGSTSTVVTGINDAGAIVGCYTDTQGSYHGFMAVPKRKTGP